VALLLVDAERRHAAYALESAPLEISYILGPLVLIAPSRRSPRPWRWWRRPRCSSPGRRPSPHRPPRARGCPPPTCGRGLSGALASPGVRTLARRADFVGLSFGAIEDVGGGVRRARRRARRDRTTAARRGAWRAWPVGRSRCARRAARPIRRCRAVAALAATDALLLAASGPLALGALLVIAGLAVAPAFAVVYTRAGDVARVGTVTEAFTMARHGDGLGLAAGSAAGGALAAFGRRARAGFLVAAGRRGARGGDHGRARRDHRVIRPRRTPPACRRPRSRPAAAWSRGRRQRPVGQRHPRLRTVLVQLMRYDRGSCMPTSGIGSERRTISSGSRAR
jgi:hypothetical protein